MRDSPRYGESADGLDVAQLAGFFVGWPHPPSAETLLRLMRSSSKVVVAVDEESGAVIGFATAMTDGVLSAYVSFLEVLPAYQGRGIGRELMRRLLAALDGLYMVDLLCDDELQPFYESVGMVRASGMMIRRHEALASDGS